jgi:hypothetical protein
MKMSSRIPLSLAAAMGIAVSTGCSGSNVLSMAQSGRPAAQAQPNGNASWMSAEARSRGRSLLYVSDLNLNSGGGVYVYRYEHGRVGALLGVLNLDEPENLRWPQGECTDGYRIWIARTVSQDIWQYVAGRARRIAALHDKGERPAGCAYDQRGGNLAVSNISSATAAEGNVVVYEHAAGEPKAYTCSNIYNYWFLTYDNRGNLYVDGESSSGSFGFCELPKGSDTMMNVSLNQPIGEGGTVLWDGKYVVVGDQLAAVLYQFTVAQGEGTEVGMTSLTGSADIVDGWIDRSTFIGPDYDTGQVELYAYPAGGSPKQTVTGLSSPTSVIIATPK